MYDDGTIAYGTIASRTTGATQNFTGDFPIGGLAINALDRFSISLGTNKTMSFKAVKLEIGTASTLENDVPPDYGSELAKCQYYYEKITATDGNLSLGHGNVGTTTTTVYVPIRIAPKRVKPTIGSGTLKLGTSSLNISASAVTWLSFDPNTGCGTLQLTIPSGQTAGAVLRFGIDQNSYITFNSDL